jgi:hypothetical protein
VTGRGILHPCPVCQDPKRECGHTKQDVRNHYAQCRETRRAVKQTPAPKRTHHRPAASGPDVFPHEGGSYEVVNMGSKLVRVRMAETPAIRRVTDEMYCDSPKDAA